jgi:hypothetical protein
MVLDTQLLTFLLIIVIIWLVGITGLIIKAISTYRDLTSGLDKKDFLSVLSQLKKDLEANQKETRSNLASLGDLNQALKSHIQKLGFVRYNPFGNTGGDQSFCLCLLDGNDNGILITSLHARDLTRLYTKQINLGSPQTKTKLSKEEADCLKQAKAWSKHKQ